MEIKSETEPGQELLSQKSSHERNSDQSSHEPTADGLDQKKFESLGNSGIDKPRKSKGFTIPSLPISTTSYEFIGDLANPCGEAFFVDGSRYQGTWDSLGMAGAGSYRMPHEVLYEGEIRDGMQHGQGSLEYPGKQAIDGVWNRGELQKWRYTFSDGLIFETENWTYCKFPDRRFHQSILKGLNPAGRSFKTQDQPTKVIPSGCYDSGDGIFDPSTLCVTNFEQPSKIIRIPSAKECNWIMKHCRKGETEPTGYQPWLNENWSPNPPNLPYRLPMSDNSPERWWKRIFTFEKDSSSILNEKRRSVEKGEDGFGIPSDRRTEGHPECVCVLEGTQPEPEIEYDVCREPDVCGDQNSKELLVANLDNLREAVCEKMSDFDEEYEGEDAEDLSMTIYYPSEDTIMRRMRISPQDLDGATEEVDSVESVGADEESEESDTYETISYWKGKELQEEIGMSNWEDEAAGFLSHEILREKSMLGEDNFGLLIHKLSKDVNELQQPKKRKPKRTKKFKTVKNVGLQKQKKEICPVVINTEQLLQRKVEDLLFSPALDAPRSPVYLVRKECDRKTCKKIKSPKHESSKCGPSSSPTNFPVKNKRGSRVCREDEKLRKKLYSETKNICFSPKPFITSQGKSKSGDQEVEGIIITDESK